jgi:hypothetical protein
MVGSNKGLPKGPPPSRSEDEFGQNRPTLAVEPDFASSLPTVRDKLVPELFPDGIPELEAVLDDAEDVPDPKPPSVVAESDFAHDRPTVARDVAALVEASLAATEFSSTAQTVAIRGQAEKNAAPSEVTPMAEILESPGIYRLKRPPIVDDITTPLPVRTPPVVEKKVRLGISKKP